jgi:hypothetical protein
MKRRVVVRALLPVVLSLPCAAQTTWFVDASATPPGDGTAGSPYASPAFALTQAATVDGDTLSVAPGTYFEHVDFLGKAVTVQGQGPGVVIDGQWTGPCVRFTSGEGPASVLRNVRLTHGGGAAVPPWTSSGGGGVLCVGSSPSLEGVEIVDNGTSATCTPHYGGGMFLLDSSPTLVDCEIDGNYACEEAGGVIIHGASSPTFTACSISFNVPAAFPGAPQGAGVSSYAVAPDIATFQECNFYGNQGGRGAALAGRAQAFDSFFVENRGTITGGAVYNVTLLERCTFTSNELFCDGSGAAPEGAGAAEGSTLVDCEVNGNRGFVGGGVRNCTVTGTMLMFNTAGHLGCSSGLAAGGGAANSTLIDCIVYGNTVEEGLGAPDHGRGGGVLGGSASSCLFIFNLADSGGGAAEAVLERCTLNENRARFDSGGAWNVTAVSSIFWGNGTDEVDPASSVTWSCVEGGFAGTGNIALDPKFWLVTGNDWNLDPNSPCIDAGDPSAPSDPDGSIADMGWKPFDASHEGWPSSYCTPTPSVLGCLAEISWTGKPSLSGPDAFHVTADSVEGGRVGLLMLAKEPGAIAVPGGTLCLTPPLTRTVGQFSGGLPFDCDGAFDFHVSHAFLASEGFAAYGNVFAQYWYRSPGAPGNAALSRALEFVVLP